ncbi:MAG TPA: hypothetical protein VNQ48_00190 [Microbacteriaceae bacterium]|nr:hypothetical protein [Microbacteriaceae bacterium]
MSATVFTWPGGEITASCDLSSLAVARQARVVVHEVLDDAPIFTTRPAGARRARLRIYCTGHTDVTTLADAYSSGLTLTITDPAAPGLLTSTIATEEIAVHRDPILGWVLEVDVTEVT